jgi:hypothetical protein
MKNQNARKHGILSNATILANEDPKAYRKLMRDHLRHFKPVGPIEKEIVREMVQAKWRQHRVWDAETASIDMQMHLEQGETMAKFERFDEPSRTAHAIKTLSNKSNEMHVYSRYETRHHRMYYRCLNALLNLQAARTEISKQNRAQMERS